MFHISTRGFYGMVFEHLQDVFDPKDFVNGFLQFHQLAFGWYQIDCNGRSSIRLVNRTLCF
jgi:hypothetical protein